MMDILKELPVVKVGVDDLQGLVGDPGMSISGLRAYVKQLIDIPEDRYGPQEGMLDLYSTFS